MSLFTDAEIAYLSSQPLGRLATAQPNGTLQVNPVGFAYNAALETIDITGFGMKSSQKYRNVSDNGRVALVVDDIASRNPWRVRFLEIRGIAQALTDSGPAGMMPGQDAAFIRIHPKKIISFGIEEIAEPHKTRSHSRKVG